MSRAGPERAGGGPSERPPTGNHYFALDSDCTSEVFDRLDGIASLSAYAALGLLPVDVVLLANVALAEKASMFLRVVAA